MNKLLKKIAPLSTLLMLFAVALSVHAQDDVMDDSDYYEPESKVAEPHYEGPATEEVYEDAPPMDSEEYAPTGDAPAYDGAGPGTPTEAIKDFNNAQEDRMDQLDSYDEDY